MNISKAEIIRIKTLEDIIETEEGLLLKNALEMMRSLRILLFGELTECRNPDEEHQIILEQLIKRNNDKKDK